MDTNTFLNLEYGMAGCAMACVLYAMVGAIYQWRCRRACR